LDDITPNVIVMGMPKKSINQGRMRARRSIHWMHNWPHIYIFTCDISSVWG